MKLIQIGDSFVNPEHVCGVGTDEEGQTMVYTADGSAFSYPGSVADAVKDLRAPF